MKVRVLGSSPAQCLAFLVCNSFSFIAHWKHLKHAEYLGRLNTCSIVVNSSFLCWRKWGETTSSFRHHRVKQLLEKGRSPVCSTAQTYPFLSFTTTQGQNFLTSPGLLVLLQSFITLFYHISQLSKDQVNPNILQNVFHIHLAFINPIWAPPLGLVYFQAPPTLRPHPFLGPPTHRLLPCTLTFYCMLETRV